MTTAQLSLWDVITNAITRVDLHAAPDWKDAAAASIETLSRQLDEITADDVLQHMERHYPDVHTHNLAALGPVFMRAQKAGLIATTGRMVQSRIPRRHRKITVWKSLMRGSK